MSVTFILRICQIIIFTRGNLLYLKVQAI